MKHLITALIVVVLALPLFNAVVQRSWSTGRSMRSLLHLMHIHAPHMVTRGQARVMKVFKLRTLWLAGETGAVTLAQAYLDSQDDIQAGVIDEFRKSSYLIENMTFDDAVSPGTNQATLIYGYQRLVTQATAAFRNVNAEYVPQEVTKARITTELQPFGGAFEIDRLLAKAGKALVDEVDLQMSQKIKAARSLFHLSAIMGETAVDGGFDGLDVALTGSTTELNAATVTNISGSMTEAQAWDVIDVLTKLLAALDSTDGNLDAGQSGAAILGNSLAIQRLQSAAMRAGYHSETEDAFGRKVRGFNGVAFVDLGARPSDNNPVVPIETRVVGVSTTGLTDIYAVRFGLDGFHGVSLANDNLVNTWLPDFSTAGAVKKGEVEMVSAVALKQTRAAAVLRNLKVVP